MKTVLSALMTGLAAVCLVGCEPMTVDSPDWTAEAAPRPLNRVIVYYMHRTLRCASCLSIERMTRETLNDTFGAELASGRLEFRTADYLLQEGLAKRYEVQTPSVVVVTMAACREVSHRNLDQVWALKGAPGPFSAYITEEVREALAKAG